MHYLIKHKSLSTVTSSLAINDVIGMIMIENVLLLVSEGLSVEVFGQSCAVFRFVSRLWFTGWPPSSVSIGIGWTRGSTSAYTRPAVKETKCIQIYAFDYLYIDMRWA